MLENNDSFEILKKHYHDGKLGHAFLFETDDSEKCLAKILDFFKLLNCEDEYSSECCKCNLCHLIVTQQLPNLIIIRPDGSFIKKEQIISLKNSLKTKPIFSKYNMYVIMNAEFLNASSANTMLKFLEEPEEKIIGFFVTNNKENVIDTIKSRCQVFSDYYSNSLFSSENIENDVVDYIKYLEVFKDETLIYNKNVLLPKIVDKNWLVCFFLKLIEIYEKIYENKIRKEVLPEEFNDLKFMLEYDVAFFDNRLNMLKNLLSTLDFNVSNQMILDRLVLESW